MLDRIEFLLGETFVALRRNGLMTVAAVSTATVALFLIGGLGFLYLKLYEYANSIPSRFEMRAFFKTGTTYDEIRKTAEAARKIEGVALVQWIPRDKAWEKQRQQYPELTEGIENPLPDALKIKVDDLSKTESVAAAVSAIPTIETGGVKYLDDLVRQLDDMMRMVRLLGLFLGGLSIITSGILISNAIQMTIHSRRREIKIMQLVGAAHRTIQIPLVLEGVVQGMVGGVLATLLLWASHGAIVRMLDQFSTVSEPGPFPLSAMFAVLLAAGGVCGFVFSGIAARSPLKYGGARA
ncbi:MAG: hypothetical protein AMXMBFR19_13540 [Chthonomonadaceae bacterium]|uniref:Cell division protein FtsX n=1 Tax=Candidatus Nitrosymbiomonas proteolyticus TaxID=2608984 RepID=A0A809RSN3_9BACT|nr:FtsX-like permease family protein [Armatimonadota bacterium]BBO22722.1 cell division protein FtsX [Candidatus Nitrosymbiomonas proteolyticus]GIK31120.1 MAG: cell division protein FtsX [Armatimonadota bacterium]